MRQFLTVIAFFLAACHGRTHSKPQTSVDGSQTVTQTHSVDTTKNIWVDKLNGQHYPLPDSIGEIPVSFYLNNPQVAAIAKVFYRGQFRPTDNDSTTQLLSLITTDDSIIRPFYRWCLDFTIRLSDGALAEYPGLPALQYATKFPKEFFGYMDKDQTQQRYQQWTGIIAYSGLSNYDERPDKIQKQIKKKMLNNCTPCDDRTQKRIDKLVKDITELVKLQD